MVLLLIMLMLVMLLMFVMSMMTTTMMIVVVAVMVVTGPGRRCLRAGECQQRAVIMVIRGFQSRNVLRAHFAGIAQVRTAP